LIAPLFIKLRELSLEELKRQYDDHATNTQVGTGFILDEIRSREAQLVNSSIRRLTFLMTVFTVVITVATILNVVVFLYDSPTFGSFLK